MTEFVEDKCNQIIEALENNSIDTLGIEVCLASLCGSFAKLYGYDKVFFIKMLNDCALESFDKTDGCEDNL